jgi:hypothetical protein
MIDNAKRLVVCCSPLQAYLWLIIARQAQIRDAQIIYITSRNTIKDKYYFNELRAVFRNVEYTVVNGRIWHSIRKLRKQLRALNVDSKCDELHIASFNTFFAMYILKFSNPTNVILYDDGVFSIISEYERNSYRFKLSVFSLLKRMAYRVIIGGESDQSVINRVTKFNTIFPTHQSLVSSNLVNSINLNEQMPKPCLGNIYGYQVVKIFLGDVIDEVPQEMKEYYWKIINLLEFDYYIPHPRSRNETVDPKKIVSTPTIAEEYILKLLELGKSVTIYSFSSTVLFTIGKHFGLKKIMIFHPAMMLPSLYDNASFFGIVRAKFDIDERRLIAIE